MSAGTRIASALPQGFLQPDMRDPSFLGELLLHLGDGAPLSQTYDRHAPLLARMPPWQGDGLMSNDPALHHSQTPQTPAPEVTNEQDQDR